MRERRRSPKTEYEREQFRRIWQTRIREMVGQEIQYTEAYKGAGDIVTIVNYVGLESVAEKWYRDLILQAPKHQYNFSRCPHSQVEKIIGRIKIKTRRSKTICFSVQGPVL